MKSNNILEALLSLKSEESEESAILYIMYKYSLHRKSNKDICPNCNKKTLVLYINVESNEIVSSKVGRCDREINCAYHYTPKAYFQDNNVEFKNYTKQGPIPYKQMQSSYHSENDLQETLNHYSQNNFIQFLTAKFDMPEVIKMVNNYKIGTSFLWNFGTVFWLVDSQNMIRGGKVIIYNTTGKRTKFINWIHSIQLKQGKTTDFNLNQCFFGEHLITQNNKTIAIVESEKTACIMSLLFNKYNWLAAGSLNGLNESKMQVLKNRKIILYPDLGINGPNGSPFTIWESKCHYFKNHGFEITISDLLELKGTHECRVKGYDIADYFLQNINQGPKIILSNQQKLTEKFYLKNKNLKILIDLFDLTDQFGNSISLST